MQPTSGPTPPEDPRLPATATSGMWTTAGRACSTCGPASRSPSGRPQRAEQATHDHPWAVCGPSQPDVGQKCPGRSRCKTAGQRGSAEQLVTGARTRMQCRGQSARTGKTQVTRRAPEAGAAVGPHQAVAVLAARRVLADLSRCHDRDCGTAAQADPLVPQWVPEQQLRRQALWRLAIAQLVAVAKAVAGRPNCARGTTP
jgi:hypothetical protein